MPVGVADGLGAIAGAELGQQVVDVALHRIGRERLALA
jgi:hypothetical protein